MAFATILDLEKTFSYSMQIYPCCAHAVALSVYCLSTATPYIGYQTATEDYQVFPMVTGAHFDVYQLISR